jgi:serine/threonine protein phosphatase PrpC
MPYLFVAIIIASFASGYGFAYKVSQLEIKEMADSIATQNQEAEALLATLTEEAKKANAKALQLNKDLEDANVSAINALNSQRDSFKSVRMYDNGRKGSRCATAKVGDSNTIVRADEDRYELSVELTEFLKSEAYRADKVSAYAKLCQNFIQGLNRDR